MQHERLTFLRMGLGRDSIAMLCLLLEGGLIADGALLTADDIDAVVFTDPGLEWQTTYDLIPTVQEMCDRAGLRFLVQRKPSIEEAASWLATLKPLREAYWDAKEAEDEAETRRLRAKLNQMRAPWTTEREGESIEDKCARGYYHPRVHIILDYASKNSVIQFKDGGCTGNHKLVPNRRLINDLCQERFGVTSRAWGQAVARGERLPHRMLVGIAADEPYRLGECASQDEAIRKGRCRTPAYEATAYPLVEMGVVKSAEHARKVGLTEWSETEDAILTRWSLNHVHKSGCAMCKFQPCSYFWSLRETDPERFDAVVRYERRALTQGRVKGNGQYVFPKTTVDGVQGIGGQPLALVVDGWREANPDATVEDVMGEDYERPDGAADGKVVNKAVRERYGLAGG